MKIFHCTSCDKTFSTAGYLVEYSHPVYGPCASYRAKCPECNDECSEKPKENRAKKNSSIPPCGSQPSCGSCCNV